MSKITYDDKTGLIPKANHINQFWDDDANEIKDVVNANDTRLTEVENISGAAISDGVKKGGYVTWQTGLIFNVSPCEYVIGGVYYATDEAQVTLTSADPTNPRLDILIVDTTETVTVITGTPAATPQKPTANPLTQLELTTVLIPAGASVPGNTIVENIVYDENTEWTPTANGVTVDFASTTEVYHGTISADISTIESGDYIKFVNVSNIDLTLETVSFFVWQKAANSGFHGFSIRLYKAGVEVSDTLIHTLSTTDSGAWENITFNATSFTYSDTQFDELRLIYFGTESTGLYLDYVKTQGGLTQAEDTGLWTEIANTISPKNINNKVLAGTKTSAGNYDLQVDKYIYIEESSLEADVPTTGGALRVSDGVKKHLYYRNNTVYNTTQRFESITQGGILSSNKSFDVNIYGKIIIIEIGGSVNITLNTLEDSSRGIIIIGHSDATAYTLTLYGNTDGSGDDITAKTESGSGQIALSTIGAVSYDVINWEYIGGMIIATHKSVQ